MFTFIRPHMSRLANTNVRVQSVIRYVLMLAVFILIVGTLHFLKHNTYFFRNPSVVLKPTDSNEVFGEHKILKKTSRGV